MRQAIVFVVLFAAAFAAAFGIVKWRAANGVADPLSRDVASSTNAPPGMVWIPGGEFVMGTDLDSGLPEEGPAHRVFVDGFWMDATEVTNAEFARFVEATGYVTTAERPPVLEEIMKQSPPGTPPPPAEKLVAGSVVFTPPDGAVPLTDYTQWHAWTPGANWRHPEGPDSSHVGRENHPVVHVCWDDAVAYATWAGKRLPTEAEWEFAARGGLAEKPYVWGDARPTPERANIWQGEFPYHNTREDGFVRTAPVKSYPANGFGLYDMSGNVWEWCADWFDRRFYSHLSLTGVTVNPTGPREAATDQRDFAPQRAQRGGSFLCCDQYCSRYRPSARHGCPPDTGLSHVGFRCVQSSTGKK